MSSGPTSLMNAFISLPIPPLSLTSGREAYLVHSYDLIVLSPLTHFLALEKVATAIRVPGLSSEDAPSIISAICPVCLMKKSP